MNEILNVLVLRCAFLWASARFRIVDSAVTTSMGGDWVLVASDVLQLNFGRDRDQVYVELRPAHAKKDWYSIDLVWTLLRGEVRDVSVVDDENAAFLAENLDEIERRFAPEEWPATRKQLEALMGKRAKRLFG